MNFLDLRGSKAFFQTLTIDEGDIALRPAHRVLADLAGSEQA
jgi:hypothetical protein